MRAALEAYVSRCPKNDVAVVDRVLRNLEGADQAQVKARAEQDAAALSDAELAERYRKAAAYFVAQLWPPSMQRVPLATVRSLSDARALAFGREVLSMLLRPGEVA